MKLRYKLDDLKKILSQATFQTNGDLQERQYQQRIIVNFPKCEDFWRMFVVPLTRRIENTDGKLGEDIHIREGMDPQLVNIASAHYSVFMHLAYAHCHYENPVPSSLENIYTHMATACDLAETVIEKWHLVRLECLGKPSKILQQLSRREFMEIASEWYDENYAKAYEHYYSKGKSKSIDVFKGKNLLKEYYGKAKARKEYLIFSQRIREYRNAVVHDVILGRLISRDGQYYIPKLNKINNYRTWMAVQDVADKQDIIDRDFIEMSQLIKDSIQGLEICLNDLWEKLIQDVMDEFYSSERNTLRQKFGFESPDIFEMYSIESPQEQSGQPFYQTSESGTFSRPDILKNTITSGSPVANLIVPNNKKRSDTSR